MRVALLAVLAVLAALIAYATLFYATHRQAPEYRMADWYETDDGWGVGV